MVEEESSFESARRAVCYRCFKAQVTCICSGLPRVDNRTEVWVLQHPREHLHPIGTERFARLGLARSRIEVAWDAGAEELSAPAWLPSDVGLLYPSPHARELATLPASELPGRLLVLDGTWHTAKTLYRDKRWLHDLPHYRITPEIEGRYRIRREPRRDYVSTIEAIAAALRILEPETTGLEELLEAFDAMIDDQIRYTRERSGARRTRKKRRPRSELRVPRALVEQFENLVVVYGESARPFHGEPRDFVYFVAHALAAGRTFECVIVPESGLPDPEHMSHMGLTPDDFRGACSNDEFCARFREFLASSVDRPLLAAWNTRTLQLLAAAMGGQAARLTLKGAYRAVHGSDANNLEQVVAQRALAVAPLGVRGRAGGRLAGAVAVARFLHQATQV